MSVKKPNHSIVLMGSGQGSTIKSICEAVESGELQTTIKALITDNPHSEIIHTAKKYQIPFFVLPFEKNNESDWDKNLVKILKNFQPDLILLAGFLKKIGPKTLTAFKNKIINTHPSLLPEFGGKGMYGLKVHKAVCDSGKSKTGVTVHIANGDYDKGLKIAQKSLKISSDDTPLKLQERVKLMEKEVCKDTLKKIISGDIFLPLSIKEMSWLFLKGVVLGLSSALPGVSGGTVAFILGIYEKIISEVSKIKTTYIFKFPFNKNHPLINDFDWRFLISLFSGAVTAIFVFALMASSFIKSAPKAFESLVFFLVLISLYFPLHKYKKNTKDWSADSGNSSYKCHSVLFFKRYLSFSKIRAFTLAFPCRFDGWTGPCAAGTFRLLSSGSLWSL